MEPRIDVERSGNPRREVLWSNFDSLSSETLLWGCAVEPESLKRRRLVRLAVKESLSSKQREVVEAYFFEGLSQGAIAKKLGISQQVVHKRIYGVRRKGKQIGGALRKLRKTLEPKISFSKNNEE
ncbi:MAG: sigma-70 family RNA polymerase sigma factor [Deltaproteobacteria bacterium]|nr:sigma-70 family RNA polymerase sigma factor [Deltaproteobacteria bacterium]